MRHTHTAGAWSVGLTGVLLVVTVVSAGIGPVSISPITVVHTMLNAIVVPTSLGMVDHTLDLFRTERIVTLPVPVIEFSPVVSYDVPRSHATIVTSIRLPRIVLGAIVGFALAAAGTVMQGFFRNPMADPSIIGVSAGAAVGAVGYIVAPVAIPFGLGLQGAAFTGALLAAFVVYVIATENGRTPIATLLLAGIAVQTFLGAVISFLLLQSGESMEQAVFWLMGHLHTSTWGDIAISLPFILVLFVLLMVYAHDLNILLLGEEDAQSLGIEVEWTKRLLLAGSSIVTAAAVAVSGIIGFVGLIVPHMMRLLVGPDHRILLPTSALAGAIFLVVTDTVARSGPVEVPVGIITAALGAPFFLYLLRTREVHAL